MSTERNVLAIALQSIKNDDIEQLEKALKVMPIEKLKDNRETLLSTFLALASQYGRAEAAESILERWKVVYPDNDRISMLSRIFMKMVITLPTLAFLVSINKTYTYVELIDELSEWDSSEEVITACGRADEIFGQQSYSTYEMLRARAVELGNFRVEEYLIDKMAETSPEIPKPERIHNKLAKFYSQFNEKLPSQEELDILAEQESKSDLTEVDIDDDEALEILTAGLEEVGIAIEEIELAKKLLRQEFSKSRKWELLKPVLENRKQLTLESDRLLFWIYGPTNPLVNQDLTLNTPSAKYGGCRMFLCDLFDYNEEDDYLEDWFLGYCEECLLRIPYRHYSVRMPREHGGWQGCFCSWKCVQERQKFIEIDSGEPNLLLKDMIEAFAKKTEEVGIQDRVYE
jgi:hypothetical protein